MIKLNYRPSVGSSLPLKLTFRDDFGAYYIPTKLKYSVVAQSADKQSWRVVDDLQDVYVEDLASEVWIPIKDLKIYKDTTPTRRVIIEWTAMINGMETPCLEEVHFEVAPTSNHEYEYDSVEDVDVNIVVKGLVALIGDEETDGTMLHRIKTNEDEIQDIHESIDSINSEIGADDVSGTVKGRIFQNETDINLTNTRIDSEVETLNDRIDSEVQTLNERIDDEVETINRTIVEKVERHETDIEAITNEIGTDETSGTLKGRITKNEGDISTLSDNVTDIYNKIGDELTDESLSHRISDNDSRIKSIEEKIDWGAGTPEEIKIFGMIDSRINAYDDVVDEKIETLDENIQTEIQSINEDTSKIKNDVKTLTSNFNTTTYNTKVRIDNLEKNMNDSFSDVSDEFDSVRDDLDKKPTVPTEMGDFIFSKRESHLTDEYEHIVDFCLTFDNVGDFFTMNDKTYLLMNGSLFEVSDSQATLISEEFNYYIDGSHCWIRNNKLYCNNGSSHSYEFNFETKSWSQKQWNGLDGFDGKYVWNRFEKTYYSNGTQQYELDDSTDTWIAKEWRNRNYNGSTAFTVGIETFIQGGDSIYKIDSNGESRIDGWTDRYGTRHDYAFKFNVDSITRFNNNFWITDKSNNQYRVSNFESSEISVILRNPSGRKISPSCFRNILGKTVCFDSDSYNVYESYDIYEPQTWIEYHLFINYEFERVSASEYNLLKNEYPIMIIGGKLYHQIESISRNLRTITLDDNNLKWTWKRLKNNFNTTNHIWCYKGNAYISDGNIQSILNDSFDWVHKTWNGVKPQSSDLIWVYDDKAYYSNGTQQYVLDDSTDTWESITWNGLSDFSGDKIWVYDGNAYYSNGTQQYKLNKNTNTWESITWNGFKNLEGSFVWVYDGNAYYSNGTQQYSLNKDTNAWESTSWFGVYSFNRKDVYVSDENAYYITDKRMYVLHSDSELLNTWKPIDDYILIEKPQTTFDGNYKVVCENGNFKLVADE